MKCQALLCFVILAPMLAACGSDEKTTIIKERTVVSPSGATLGSVEANCQHGYDNAAHSCY